MKTQVKLKTLKKTNQQNYPSEDRLTKLKDKVEKMNHSAKK